MATSSNENLSSNVVPAEKAQIIRIGDWDKKRDAPTGWIFGPSTVGMQVGSSGQVLHAGYTTDELREIWRKRRVG